MVGEEKDYRDKRRFEETPEPQPSVSGNVDPTTARPGPTFMVHQHHATRLHFDLRLEMLNGDTPVLVSWAVPKNLPQRKGERHLAVHVEDHPFEYGGFSGTIPAGNYGAGEVRIFDSGTYEVL
jgi:bifunctional non-homologous end joining protein LigD